MEDLNGKLIYVYEDKLYYFKEGGASVCMGNAYDDSMYCPLYPCSKGGKHPLLSVVCPVKDEDITVTGRWREL